MRCEREIESFGMNESNDKTKANGKNTLESESGKKGIWKSKETKKGIREVPESK